MKWYALSIDYKYTGTMTVRVEAETEQDAERLALAGMDCYLEEEFNDGGGKIEATVEDIMED